MEKLNAIDGTDAEVIHATPEPTERTAIKGRFDVVCFDRYGNEKWRDVIHNVVTTAGANLVLDTMFSATAYAVTGAYMGLIGTAPSFTAVSSTDTMAIHSGWTECGQTAAVPLIGPTSSRRILGVGGFTWGVASARTKSITPTPCNFTFTGTGTVQGCFIVFGTGAVGDNSSTAGTLFSAGTFSGGFKGVVSSDQINCSYSVSI